jgi:phosphoserine aminotransferase
LIYAGSHKNIGPAGMTIVIVKKALIQETLANTPSLYSYEVQAKNNCLYNTPPTFAWYTAGLVFKWLKKQGGLKEMARLNHEKARMLYGAIDQSRLYRNTVPKTCRSISNITFQLTHKELETAFLKESKARGLLNLKGHRSIGGLRASLYNAMPIEGVEALVHFMREFEGQCLKN